MNAHAILASLFIGLVWLVVTGWVMKRKKLSAVSTAMVFSLPLLLGNTYYYGWLAPQQQQQASLDKAQQQLASQPVWRTIKYQEPELYRQASNRLADSLRAGLSFPQAIEQLRPLAADLLNQRISAARDGDLNDYMQISLEEMKLLRQQGADMCFRFLFPQVKGGMDINEKLPETLISRELLAMDTLLKHSQGNEKTLDLQAGRAQLQAVVHKLYGRWGSDLQTLNTPAEPGIDEGKLCDMTIDLYQSVLALTGNDSANVLRIIISGTGN